MYINKYYLLDDFDWSSDSSSIFLVEVNKNLYNNCIIVENLTEYDEEYIIREIGTEKYDYTSCKEGLKYTGYFYINYNGKNEEKFNLTKKEIDFTYSKKIFGQQLYSNDGVREIVKYNKHKEGIQIIIWEHSLGADSTLEAYAVGYKEIVKYEKVQNRLKSIWQQFNPQKADELNVIMPRISFIQKYITKASENSKIINLFVMRGDKFWFPYYGDRSYETLIKKINSGKIKIPSNVRIIPLDKVKGKGTFNNHGSALKYNDKMFKQIEKEYMKVRGKNEK